MLRIALVATLFVPSFGTAAEPPAPDAKAVEFFETKIRPVLVEQCYKCHSEEAAKEKKLKGGLKLDTKAGLLAGGDTGAALVPGKPDAGTLLKSMKYDGELQMPPKGKLPDAVVKDFEKWIADGAADPRTGDIAKAAGIDIEKGKQFWSLQKPKEPAIPGEPPAGSPAPPPASRNREDRDRRVRRREVGRKGTETGRAGRQAGAHPPGVLRSDGSAADSGSRRSVPRR
ncbi:c-type cytochrome domain-containing protein [Frigoriglobus tundricola]|uniref:Cytochrome C Planctomycete-type domain-containing protein n=1 Tax=Frigoriglobus tundricola TaxID=2774151 RepID=A0A6M5YSA7_9BACT|nr:c-type cytochrome domain-containing protein [Frigoriglobus tundricola]QJW96276.1 hypothetical protein FTUN_3833 [Frigoriglobus tundricola]